MNYKNIYKNIYKYKNLHFLALILSIVSSSIFYKTTYSVLLHANNNINNSSSETNKSGETGKSESTKCQVKQPSLINNFVKSISSSVTETVQKWKNKLSSIFSETGSKWIRFFIALILGILLSLTPCIYPMIPITIGVLQINQRKSALGSFLMAAAYTIGISVTFAAFGFITAIGSCIFGQLQGSPWTILPLVVILIYFGLSMFGFYELYIPEFLQPKTRDVKGGSFLSAFIFGIISGTIASPCLSPGLLLILDYVSNLGSTGGIIHYLEGFGLLFIFGVGSSLPLLIIGTFSSSSSLLPKAGMWMVEVKKLLGLMLVMMAFYHLSHLTSYIPWAILLWIIVISILAIAVYYLLSISKRDSLNMKLYKALVAILLFIVAGTMVMQKSTTNTASFWIHDFSLAQKRSQSENKPLFIDLGSEICMACKSIDKKIFGNPEVIETLKENYLPIKIEYEDHKDSFDKIKELYGPIRGFPTFLIIGKNGELVKKLGAELEDLSIQEVISLLKSSV